MSSNQNHEFDVLKVVELARQNKYEITSAGFAALDKIEKINTLPKKMRTRKPAVQALFAISEGLVKYDYFSPEQRRKLMQEAGMSDAPFKFAHNTNAPVAEEDMEEEDLPQEEPKVNSSSDEDGEFDDEEEPEEDSDEEP